MSVVNKFMKKKKIKIQFQPIFEKEQNIIFFS